MGGTIASSSTSVTSQTFIEFASNGRYQKSGFSAASFTNSAGGNQTGGSVNNQRGLEAGAYAIDGFTLTLTPASGGTPEEFTIVLENPSGSPQALFINDNAFLR